MAFSPWILHKRLATRPPAAAVAVVAAATTTKMTTSAAIRRTIYGWWTFIAAISAFAREQKSDSYITWLLVCTSRDSSPTLTTAFAVKGHRWCAFEVKLYGHRRSANIVDWSRCKRKRETLEEKLRQIKTKKQKSSSNLLCTLSLSGGHFKRPNEDISIKAKRYRFSTAPSKRHRWCSSLRNFEYVDAFKLCKK